MDTMLALKFVCRKGKRIALKPTKFNDSSYSVLTMCNLCGLFQILLFTAGSLLHDS